MGRIPMGVFLVTDASFVGPVLRTTVFKGSALQASVFVDSALQAMMSTGFALQALMSVESALRATMSAGSALQATMFLVIPSTLLLAGGGKGVQTENDKGEFEVTSNITLPSTPLFDYGLVRTKSLPQSEKCLLLSFKKRLQETYEESRLCLAERAVIMFRSLCFRRVRVEKMFERGRLVAVDDVFLLPTLTLILRATFSGIWRRFLTYSFDPCIDVFWIES